MLISLLFHSADASLDLKGPPPPRPITAEVTKPVYVSGEILTIQGRILHQGEGDISVIIHDPEGKVHRSGNVIPFQNGSYTYTYEIQNEIPTGMYSAEVKYANSSSQVRFMIITGPFRLTMENTEYLFDYRLTSGMLNDIALNSQNNSLTLFIAESSERGQLNITLPRNVIDAQAQGTGADMDFVVMIGNSRVTFTEAQFSEIARDNNSRTLSISIPYNGTDVLYDDWQINVIGSRVIPEFGGIEIASILAFLTSIVFAFRKGLQINHTKSKI
jgi:hypothetical protein